MPLSWNEIRGRAHQFSRTWADETSEAAEKQTFLNEFFNVFGVSRRRVASFEKAVRTEEGGSGRIDLIWKGVLLIEQKSRGKDLDRAYQQAKDYFPGLKDRDLPRYILVSDFARFRLYDLEEGGSHEFSLKQLHENIRLFGFMAGYQTTAFKEQDPVNFEAAQRMGRLHDRLKAIGYSGHGLEVYLVRLLFCLFAEDTGIFERRRFQDLIEQRTQEDGSDLAPWLAQLFEVLDTPENQRLKNLDEQLAAFQYINGDLFQERLPTASFDREMRESLLQCCGLDWSRISPAIFGALFQSVMDETKRRNLGAHYTSEKNILKVIAPLFLDDLRAEFEKSKRSPKRLQALHEHLASLRFMDPACGCGNFLVIAYRELRQIELDILRILHKDGRSELLDVKEFQEIRIDVDQFHGIEIEEFPVQIARTAMWLMDHQMNLRASEAFGGYFARLPLQKAARIIHDNALRIPWRDVAAPTEMHFIFGNPPFVGGKFMTAEQQADRERVFPRVKNAGLLDYVACWYGKTVDYMMANPAIRAAFVSTNSISQGEQPGALWSVLLARGTHIHFAHRTFQWSSEVRGKAMAAVHCVIIGFGLRDDVPKRLYEYDDLRGDPHEIAAKHINPYLVDGPDILLGNRGRPLCDVPEMGIGNKPIDDGNYLFSPEEKTAFIGAEPASARFFRRWLGSDEFINGYERWCLWLGDCPPEQLRKMPEAMKRVEAVRDFRLKSKSAGTRDIARTPRRFHVENMPASRYLAVPEVSSERRPYIPIGFMRPATLASNLLKIVPHATLYHFGVLSSAMHMAWVRSVCGRLKSDYRYSSGIVYNNFPWPGDPPKARKSAIEKAAQAVLDSRAKHPRASLADLYDPHSMPSDLAKSHHRLDAAVDAAYGKRKFKSDAERVAFLFGLYVNMTKA